MPKGKFISNSKRYWINKRLNKDAQDRSSQPIVSENSQAAEEVVPPVPSPLNLNFSKWMAWWAVNYKIPRNSLKDLCKYVNENLSETVKYPTDYRTILKTPKISERISLGEGIFQHIGVDLALGNILNSVDAPFNDISLQVFVDGVSISKSTKDSFWVVMIRVAEFGKEVSPQLVTLHHGLKKPCDFNAFLTPLEEELSVILANGFRHNETLFRVKSLLFIADAPARAAIKMVRLFNAYNGCDFCETEGVYTNQRMTFPNLQARQRTDELFRSRAYDNISQYHQGVSILENLNINMIRQFPPDSLHQVYLGVAKKLFTLILSGMSRFDHELVLSRITAYRATQPIEFSRKIRSLREINSFKATEFRTFVLYIAPLIFKDIVSDAVIECLTKFQLICTIYTNDRFKCFYKSAGQIVKMFIELLAQIWGEHNLTYNVHVLSHFEEFCCRLGSWDQFSSFPFESHNSYLKKLITTPRYPVTQVVNRIQEEYHAPKLAKAVSLNSIIVSKQSNDFSFGKLQLHGLTFKPDTTGQNIALLKDGSIFKISKIVSGESGVNLEGRKFTTLTSLYDPDYFFDTTLVNIYKSKKNYTRLCNVNSSEILAKCWEIPLQNDYVALFPLYIENSKYYNF